MSNKTNQGREQYIFDRIGEVLTSHIIRLRDRGEVASANHLVDCFSQQISDIEAGLDPLCYKEIALCPEAFQVAGLAENML